MLNIKKMLFKWQLKRKIKEANQDQKLTGYTTFVHYVDGKFIVKHKQEYKRLIAQRKFKKGITIQKIEAMALHKTR